MISVKKNFFLNQETRNIFSVALPMYTTVVIVISCTRETAIYKPQNNAASFSDKTQYFRIEEFMNHQGKSRKAACAAVHQEKPGENLQHSVHSSHYN